MSKLNSRKIIRAINKAIALNPTEITFTQVSLEEVDGAYERTTDEKTITVTIYLDDASNNSLDITSTAKGTSYTSTRYKMVADKDAGLEINPEESINFESNGNKFEIKAVYPQIIEDTICG